MKNNKWILLAEDDVNIAELTTMVLDSEKLGCKVVVVHDGLEALDCLYQRGESMGTRGLPVVALLDVKMPRLDGLEVLSRIKSDERMKSVPVVMLTSSREESDLIRCYRLGANAYVVKPVDFKEFSRAIKIAGEFWTTINEQLPQDAMAVQNQHPSLTAAA